LRLFAKLTFCDVPLFAGMRGNLRIPRLPLRHVFLAALTSAVRAPCPKAGYLGFRVHRRAAGLGFAQLLTRHFGRFQGCLGQDDLFGPGAHKGLAFASQMGKGCAFCWPSSVRLSLSGLRYSRQSLVGPATKQRDFTGIVAETVLWSRCKAFVPILSTFTVPPL